MTEDRKHIEIKRPPTLFKRTQPLLKQLQQQLDGPLITYWHGTNGSVCQNDVVGFYEVLKQLGPSERLYLFIKSDGGTGTASLRIVNLLRQFTQRLTVLVPLECISAATMVALGADAILMGPLAQLSAVDTSLTHDLSPVDKDNRRVRVSLDELSRILKVWGQHEGTQKTNPYQSIFSHVHPLVIGAVDRASSLSIRLCKEILEYHMTDAQKVQQICDTLNADYPSHAYPITLREARRIGLNVAPLDPALNEQLLALNQVYSEMGQRALTDYDERNYHDNEILNILEVDGAQVFYQSDQDWHYRTEERRWIPMNDHSSWRRIRLVDGEPVESVFHIR
jgi:ClpP class serine protease